jgi:hypothetical protein
MSEKPVVSVHEVAGEGKYVFFWCPGCRGNHAVSVENPNNCGAKWWWNGDLFHPTFWPSILVSGSKMTELGEKQYNDWTHGKIQTPEKFDSVDTICHSFVRDGRIEFLVDCTHELAGKIVDVEPVDDEFLIGPEAVRLE